jgi:D-alanyl-D-alanine carboxypeptidase/D-alanyl-D-alanine-endopeptidase (penicillin-binding protein 4)
MIGRLLLGLCGASALLAQVPAVKAARPLSARLNTVLARSPLLKRSVLGIHVVQLDTGKVLYTRNAGRMFVPASNMKLVTTAAALTRLGPEHRFRTEIIAEPSGDLVLRGAGDPTMSARTYPYMKDAPDRDPMWAIDDLADQAIAAGLTSVDGDIVGDDTAYPWAPYAPSWTQEDSINEDGAPVSALTFNDNIVSIHVRAGESPGDLAELDLSPSFEYFFIDNRVTTIARGRQRVRAYRRPGSNQLMLWGSVLVGRQTTVLASVDDPALYAAHALYEALVRRGIPIRGKPVARHVYGEEPPPPGAGKVLAVRVSPPMTEILQVVNKVSQNLHAELLLREIGRVNRHEGTREAGIEELASMIDPWVEDKEDYRFEDGSGLSRNALLTPHTVTNLLGAMYATPPGETYARDVWVSTLPVGGEDGTLSSRLCCVSDAHNIHAKTGTLARSVALSGYADSKTHGMLAFSIIVNNFYATGNAVRAWVDKMALELVE